MEDDSNNPTLKDIADAAGVSIASVSKVMNNRGGVGDEVRRKILDHAKRLGYQIKAVRSRIRAGVERAVIVTPLKFYERSQFYEDIIRGALEEAEANSLTCDVRVVSLNPDETRAEIETLLSELQPDAFIALGIDDSRVIDLIVDQDIPAVIINGMDRTMRVSCALPDNWSAGWLATQRLLSAGHREIVHVTLPHRLSLQRRLDGFRVALEEAGINFSPDHHLFNLEDYGIEESEAPKVIRESLRQGRFANTTAFFCSTDVIAIGLLQTLQSAGYSVPGDYSIIGVDDIAIAGYSQPALTTMRIDRTELGRTGVQILFGRIANPPESIRRVNLGVKLIERESVAAPRA